MKGSLHTDELMGAVVATRRPGCAPRGGSAMCFIMDVPTYPRPADHHRRGDQHRARPRGQGRHRPERHRPARTRSACASREVAILSAVETVNPKIPSTIDAAALCKMADRGQITGGLLDGPLALDNAISPEAAADQGHRLAGRRAGQHPGGARPRGRQHAGQEPVLPGRRRCGRHRAGRARADHPDQPGGSHS